MLQQQAPRRSAIAEKRYMGGGSLSKTERRFRRA